MKRLVCLICSLSLVACAILPVDVQVPRLTDNRIVGGVTANIAEFPHQGSLRYKSITQPQNSYAHRCGISVLNENVGITAAHCIIATVPSQFQVVFGTNNRRGNDGVIVPVQKIIMHEDYDPYTFDNDIALLVFGASVPLNNYTIRAIELSENDARENQIATITGWGTTTEGGFSANELQKVSVPIVSNEVCNDDYEGSITDSMLCAGLRGVGGKDACQGDSGGPLVVNKKLAGIVSWGYGCARPEFPGVYAKVSYLLPWIMEKVDEIQEFLEQRSN